MSQLNVLQQRNRSSFVLLTSFWKSCRIFDRNNDLGYVFIMRMFREEMVGENFP